MSAKIILEVGGSPTAGEGMDLYAVVAFNRSGLLPNRPRASVEGYAGGGMTRTVLPLTLAEAVRLKGHPDVIRVTRTVRVARSCPTCGHFEGWFETEEEFE